MNEKSENQLKSSKNPLIFAGLAIIFSLLIISTFQSQTITFQKTILAPDIEYFRSVVQTPDEGYIAVGRKRESGIRDDMYIVRYNKFGDTLWTKTIDKESAVSLIKTYDNNYAAIGVHGSFVKFDINGNILNLGTYYNEDLTINKILQTPDNSFFICGRFFPNTFYPYLAKFNSNGVLMWDSIYSASIEYGIITDMILTDANNLITIGLHKLQSNQSSFMFIGKVNQLGSYLWLNTVNEYPNYYSTSIAKTNTGEFITCADDYLAKFDPQGGLLWRKIQDSVLSVGYNSIIISNDGNYVYTGWLDSADYQYIRIRKTDTSGTEIWRKLHGFTDKNHTGWNIKETSDSGFVVVGRTFIQGEDPYILKVDKKGDLLPPIGIIILNNEIPDNFILEQNFPNPFNPVTNIKYEIPNDVNVSIKIYDILGREVFSFNEYKLAGSYEVHFDGSNFASGMYFYKMVVGDNTNNGEIFTDTKKMVLIK